MQLHGWNGTIQVAPSRGNLSNRSRTHFDPLWGLHPTRPTKLIQRHSLGFACNSRSNEISMERIYAWRTASSRGLRLYVCGVFNDCSLGADIGAKARYSSELRLG